MRLWESVRLRLRELDQKQEWLAIEADLNFRTMLGWMAKNIMPNADQTVAIARALQTTVEYLVTGEKPDVDVPWYNANRQLIADLKALTPDQLDTISTTARVQAEKNRAAGERDHANATGSA